MSETTTVEVTESSTGGDVTTAVVEGIAAVNDCEPMEIDVRLAEYVDPDALDALFEPTASRDRTIELTATVDQYDITVHSSGYVTVSRRVVTGEASEAAVEI